MNNYSLTVITVVKNDQNNIEKTIKSIISNNNVSLEYIIVDGKSTDQTLSVIDKYKSKIDKIITENDQGIYDAMNKGIKNSKNDIIVFCNSGDFFYDGALAKIMKIFNEQKLDYVFGTVVRNYTKGQIIKSKLNPERIYYNFDFATSHSTGFFLKRSIYKKIGLYNTNFKCSADYDLYYRMIKQKYLGAVTSKDELIGNVASGGFSSNFTFLQHLTEETKIRIHNKQNIIFVFIIFFNAILKKIFKNFFKFI